MRNRLKGISKQLNNIIRDKDWMKHVEEYVFEEEEDDTKPRTKEV